jgi:hypothetical protein
MEGGMASAEDAYSIQANDGDAQGDQSTSSRDKHEREGEPQTMLGIYLSDTQKHEQVALGMSSGAENEVGKTKADPPPVKPSKFSREEPAQRKRRSMFETTLQSIENRFAQTTLFLIYFDCLKNILIQPECHEYTQLLLL